MGGRKKKKTGGPSTPAISAGKKTTRTSPLLADVTLEDVSLISVVDLLDDTDDDNGNKSIDCITLDDTPIKPIINCPVDSKYVDPDDSAFSVASLSLDSPTKSTSAKSPSPRQKTNNKSKVKSKKSGKVRSYRKNENTADSTLEIEDGEIHSSNDEEEEEDDDDDSDIEIVGVKMKTPASKKRKTRGKSRQRFPPTQLDFGTGLVRRRSVVGHAYIPLSSSNLKDNSNPFNLKPKLVGIQKKNKKKNSPFSKKRRQIDPKVILQNRRELLSSPVVRIKRNSDYKSSKFYQNAIQKNYNTPKTGKTSKFTFEPSTLHPAALGQAKSNSLISKPALPSSLQQPPTSSSKPERTVKSVSDGPSFQVCVRSKPINSSYNTTTTNPSDPVPGSSSHQQQQSSWSLYGTNLFNAARAIPVPGSLRPIIIDGSNVAMSHGRQGEFSCRGIRICVDFFKGRGHEQILAFVPQFRKKLSQSIDTNILDDLERENILKCTPSRDVGFTGKRISSYDDRFIVQCAADMQGIIVSNDNFRDLYDEQPLWRETIHKRVLGYVWVSETMLMFPPDPLGKEGPALDQFLKFESF